MQAGFRSDQLADAYYGDSELNWLIYLANEIVDPYYQWYMDDLTFNEFILEKYGEIDKAAGRIKFYRNNWYEDQNEISPTYYMNSLPYIARKYYEPVYGPKAKILSYKRKEVDWITNTNRILQYDITLANSQVEFANNELVSIKHSGEVVGTGEVIVSNSTVLIVQHVSGNTSANNTATKTIIGTTTGANAETASVLTLQENFTTAEARFWSTVSYFDWENELNESRKHIEVVDSGLSIDIGEQIRKTLNK